MTKSQDKNDTIFSDEEKAMVIILDLLMHLQPYSQ